MPKPGPRFASDRKDAMSCRLLQHKRPTRFPPNSDDIKDPPIANLDPESRKLLHETGWSDKDPAPPCTKLRHQFWDGLKRCPMLSPECQRFRASHGARDEVVFEIPGLNPASATQPD